MSSKSSVSGGSRRSKTSKAKPAAKRSAKSTKSKTLEVAVSGGRSTRARSSKRSQAVAAATAKKTAAKKAKPGTTKKTTSKKTPKAAKQTKSTSKKAAQKPSKAGRKVQKVAMNGKAKKPTKAAATQTSTKAETGTKTAPSTPAKVTVSSLIPAPTKEVLRPFREAAKRTRKLQKERQKLSKRRGDFLAKQVRKGKKYKIDLRVHTPGSYGFFSTGGIDPAPALVRLARVKGLDMIGVTDYYNVSYIDDIRAHAEAAKITVLPGFDIRCRVGNCDEVTFIALFPPECTGADLKAVLDSLAIPESAYGRPDYILEKDVAEVLDCIEASGGIVIPSRVDKTPFRRLAIPYLVERFGFHAFDLVHSDNPEFFREKWPSGGFTFFSFSNANALAQIGNRTATVKLSAPGFEGLKELIARRPGLSEAEAA